MSAHIGKTRSTDPLTSEASREHDMAARRLSNRGGHSPESSTPSHSGAHGRGYFPADLMVMAYLIVASALLIFSPLPVSERTQLTGLYLLLLIAVSCLRFVPRQGHPWLQRIRDWYPLVLIPVFYNSAQHLNRLVTTGYFDNRMTALEQAIFGMQPSEELWRLVPAVAVSEFLHFSYLAYAPTILGVTLFLYLARTRRELHFYITSVMTTFIFCFCMFILLPVKGPFQFFGPLNQEALHGFFARTVHWMLQGGSSVGTAFPSSHVAAITCVWLVSRRSLGRLSWIVLTIAVGIFIGTVYGGFHYAVDAVAGVVVGLALGAQGPRIHTAITRWLEGSRGIGRA